LRLKIEINTREHLRLLPPQQTAFRVASRWFTGDANLSIYSTTELLGTKLRALYQRRKGRDLFDLWQAHQAGVLDPQPVTETFSHYMKIEGNIISATDFNRNLEAKIQHAGFLSDTPPLLRPGVTFDPKQAHQWISESLIPLLSVRAG